MAVKRREAPARRSRARVRRGTGASPYTVKGKRATARQRAVIDGVLSQAREDRASRRVMVAAIMTITQESVAGESLGRTGAAYTGIYQQSRAWISADGSKNPEKSTHAFLITGPTSWKKVHGSVKRAPGNLSQAIERVQRSGNPNAYARWEDEAEETVKTWLAEGDGGGDGKTYTKRYSFTRGEKGGQRESSWDAALRLVDEVGGHRWAAGNTFYAVSGDELRAQASSLIIHGDEGWLMKQPSWSWAARRAIAEVTMQALSDRWDVMPGGLVTLARGFGPMQGRWLVWNVSGASLDSPEVTVVLRRPTRLKSEPPSEKATREEGGGGDGGGKLREVCQDISENRSEYLYGGGHGKPLSSLRSNTPMDCSSSSSLALYRAKMMGGRKTAIVSGEFARSWGKRGKGKEFTVWANPGHMWIEGYDADGKFAWRFDTSQHGGKSGPAYVTKPRNDHERFTAKHWPGR